MLISLISNFESDYSFFNAKNQYHNAWGKVIKSIVKYVIVCGHEVQHAHVSSISVYLLDYKA